MVNPVRNRKIGFSDEQANGGQPSVAIDGIPQRVIDDFNKTHPAFDTNQNQMSGDPSGTIPPVATVAPSMGFLGGGNRVMGRYENPQQGSSSAPTTPYMKDAADRTPQNVTNFENMPIEKQAIGWNPDGTPKYASLSDALNGNTDLQQAKKAQFKADPSQKDGGFYSWIRGLSPKKRPGKREGETDDEYDSRRTRNMQMVATFADAIRHMGNIVNTSKGAPLQVFNDPTTMLEQGRQQRKAERQKKAAADADMAYKQANMTLKERAAEADRLYKQLTLGYKDAADKRAQRQFEYQVAKDAAAAQRQAEQDKQKQDNWEKNFSAKQQQNAISNGLRQQSINKRGSGRSGKGGSGSGGKYWFEDKNGKMHYQPNKTMWEQEFYREYGYLPNETSSSTSKKTIDKNGNEITTTTRKKGTAMTSEAAKKQNDAKAARQKAAAAKKAGSGKSAGKSKNGYKNTKALGL